MRPIRAGDFEGLRLEGGQVTVGIDLLTNLIQSWSYQEPVTRENVASLDVDTWIWLQTAIQSASGIRDDVEKKESDETSSSQPEAEATSLVTSGI